MRSLLALVLLLSLTGCGSVPIEIAGDALPHMGPRPLYRPETRPTTVFPAEGWGWKTVVRKRAPSLLIATDGTVCTATESKFETTAVKERVWCSWASEGRSIPGADPPAI